MKYASTIVAKRQKREITSYKKMTWAEMSIKNRALAIGLSFDKAKYENDIQKQIDNYNSWLEKVLSVASFMEYFEENDNVASLSSVKTKFGTSVYQLLNSVPQTCFSIPFHIFDDYFLDTNVGTAYSYILGGMCIDLNLCMLDDEFLPQITGKRFLYNWQDAPDDAFCLGVWSVLNEYNLLPVDEDDCTVLNDFDYWYMETDTRCINLEKYTRELEDKHYITRHLLKPEDSNVRWKYYFRKDGTLDVGLLDMSFLDDNIMKEKIAAYLAPNEITYR